MAHSLSSWILTPRIFAVRAMATISRQVISGNLSLATVSPVNIAKKGHTWQLEREKPRPLVLLLEYMNGQPKHIDKFVEFYHERDLDVLMVRLKPWQLFLPSPGSHVVAKELAEFILANSSFCPIVYHGFSVGGYLWGEVLRLCIEKYPRYLPVTERVCAQVLDSGVDVTQIPTAFPKAVLPNSPVTRLAFQSLIKFHMTTFYYNSTRHYEAARKAFTHGLIRGPVLLLYSDADPLSTREINEKCRSDFEKINIPVTLKEFKGSKHVMHFQKHRDDYLRELAAFLDKLDLKPESRRLPNISDDARLQIKSKL